MHHLNKTFDVFFRFTTYLSDAVESYIGKKLNPYHIAEDEVMVLEDRVREAQLFANKVSSLIFHIMQLNFYGISVYNLSFCMHILLFN